MTPLYTYIFFYIFFSIVICQMILNIVLCAVELVHLFICLSIGPLFIYPIFNSLPLLIPNSHSFSSPSPNPLGNQKSVLLHRFWECLQKRSDQKAWRRLREGKRKPEVFWLSGSWWGNNQGAESLERRWCEMQGTQERRAFAHAWGGLHAEGAL